MRLTLSLLGWSFDVSLEPTATDADEGDPLRDLGATGSTPVGFIARHDVPEEIPYQPHTPAWDEPEERGR